MLISLDWLKQYVDIKEDIKELENTLTMIGQEVEAIEEQGKELAKVVIGQITEYGKHPEAEKLTLLKVNIGEEEELQIVCGAPNHKLGDKVVVATIGAVLPGDFKIKKSKIRGVESQGMLCSEVELGLGNDGDGIIILPEDAPLGVEYRVYKKLNDVIFELEITPNRPDCLSYIGIAREIAAYYGRKIKCPEFESKKIIESINTGHIDVRIEDKERCKRFSGKVIKNIKVQESPEWLKNRLISMGLKPINNVVDATNYILFECNQPLHAYDLTKINDRKIIVRKSLNGEKIVTLDGVERELNKGELIIADAEKPLGIAGIMGGESSKVTEETTEIFLECAYFTPENIRKTSKELGLSSDSSYRFERGLDIENTAEVLERAADLISQLTGGEVLEGCIDKYIEKYEKIEIPLNIEKLRKFMGKNIEIDVVGKILTNLGINIKTLNSTTIIATPPSYRGDLTRTADLYEEIIRMYGFDNIENKMPEENIRPGVKDSMTVVVDEAKEILAKLGLQEVINYSFISKDAIKMLGITEPTLEITNPISDDMAVMRPTLIYSLLSNVRDNLNRNQNGLRFFEVSRVFTPKEDGLANETLRASIALAGKTFKTLWDPKPEAMDFYTLKGFVEKFLEYMGVTRYQLDRSEDNNFHPGRSADIRIGKVKIGTFGEIHPELAENMDIKRERAYVAELDLTTLLNYRAKKVKYERIVKYPEVTRDLAVVLDRDVLVGKMLEDIKKSSNLIESVAIFDVYQGEKIEADKKSVAISIVLRKKDGTLEESDINITVDKILKLIAKNYNGEIRQ
ncbi:MAG: phenylalanine--tRNA ligase subunit beta [Cetobacterium somerae]|uniref:phenylalanine--tRNA ligase subunit beta n=1 Tax=Cetobacterium TaxID=180162 RepID=UPI00163B7BF3|nr:MULTISPECIES: phenylalanine--tRNA ligase subunit beta [Cetobacterium]MBC2852745.1 phenylalanine--tRNA ligase subunit beta [Cetobacterium sp. 2G large]MCQ9627140.1 phenylalanine--tRNA ligase subunit beta [Cetobacterium somerae]WVJ00929.1 phenylalanine--tRNA ligase subunit beta [Cetobacterium somerae]